MGWTEILSIKDDAAKRMGCIVLKDFINNCCVSFHVLCGTFWEIVGCGNHWLTVLQKEMVLEI